MIHPQQLSLFLASLLCLWLVGCGDVPDSRSASDSLAGSPASLSGSSASSSASSSGSPYPLSAILITLDTTRADALSAYGAPIGTTPNIDRLARRGLRYDAARAVAPLTMPSHASMLTGLFPPRHSVRNNHVAPLPASAHTLAELARENGIDTAAFVSTVALDPALGFDQGFDHYESPARRMDRGAASERVAGDTVDRAIDWLKARDTPDATRPFYLWLHLYDPHDPYAPPAEFARRFPHDPYRAEVAYMDAELGRFFDFLEAAGRRDDTLVMLVGDHGEGLGQRGEKFHGILLYDETIRVPLVVSDPSGWRAGESTREIVSVVDVFPTLAEAMGLPSQDGLDGSSLFRRKSPDDRGVYFETYQPWILHNYAPFAGWADSRGKYLHAAAPEFYDLTSDPAEASNLATARANELGRYRDAIARVAAAPALPRSDDPADGVDRPDPSLLAELQALGYLAAGSGDESFPHPLDVSGRPAVARWVKENAAFQRAEKLLAASRFDEALAIEQAILVGNPNNWHVVYGYAFALMRAGRHIEALEQLLHYQTGGPPARAPS